MHTPPREDPDAPPRSVIVHRSTARVLPRRADGRFLLLHGWDPDRPHSPYWFTIGGAVDGDESLLEAAARELGEETGIMMPTAAFSAPLLTSTIEFTWAGRHIVQEQTFFTVDVEETLVSFDGHDSWEQATIDGFRWWTPAELAADGGAAHADILTALDRANAPR